MLELLLHCLHLCTLLDEHNVQILVILLGQDTLLVSLPLEILTKLEVVICQLHNLLPHGLIFGGVFLPVFLDHRNALPILLLHLVLLHF